MTLWNAIDHGRGRTAPGEAELVESVRLVTQIERLEAFQLPVMLHRVI